MKSLGWIKRVPRIVILVPAMALMSAGAAAGVVGDQTSTKSSTAGEAKSKPAQGLRIHLARIEERRQAALAELKLSDDQVRGLNKLLDEQAEKITEIIRRSDEVRRENAARIEELNNEMKEARLNRDVERAQQIARELSWIDPSADRAYKTMLGFDKTVAKALGGEQGAAYRGLALRLKRKWRPNVKPFSFSIVLEILVELRLTKEQNAEVLAVLRELSPELSSAHTVRDYIRMHKVEAVFRQRVLDILTDEQRTRYLQLDRKRAADADSQVSP